MIHKLVTLPRGTTKLPILQVGSEKVTIGLGQQNSVAPQTFNFAGVNNTVETSGYLFTIADRRLVSSFVGVGANSTAATSTKTDNSDLDTRLKSLEKANDALNNQLKL